MQYVKKVYIVFVHHWMVQALKTQAFFYYVSFIKFLRNFKCKEKYGWMEPDPGLCGASSECKDGLFCDGGKCQWENGSREIGETCNQHKSCKNI